MNEEPGREFNLLTQRLLAEGFTRENHPDYVEDRCWYDGGFEYTFDYLKKMVFATGCGLHIKGSYWSDGYMSFMGIDWTVENDMPTINCPYRKVDCPKNHELLRKAEITKGRTKTVFCSCHQIKDTYSYENSLEKVYEEKNQREEALFQKFSEAKGGRVCRTMCYFDEHKDQWIQNYDPLHVCTHTCSYCTILGRELTTKRGNVFYDLLIRRKVESGVGLLYESKTKVTVLKGKRLLSSPVSLDICEAIIRCCTDEILFLENMEHHTEAFHAKYHGDFFELEVLNIRAERRESRDLMQDLEDVKNGISVVHESDQKAAAKAVKSENRSKAILSRKRKYLKMLADKSLDDIDAVYKYRIKRMVERGILNQAEIDEARRKKQGDRPCEQLSLFE